MQTRTRDFYRPAGLTPALEDAALGVEVYHIDETCAKAFAGKSAKPAFYIRFRSIQQRNEHVAKWLDGVRAEAARKAAAKAAKKTWQHGLAVGDVFVSSWGYDQTNIDHFQIVSVHGRVVEVLELQQERHATGDMQGTCVPLLGQYATEPDYTSAESLAHKESHGCYLSRVPAPRRFVPQPGLDGVPYLRIASYAIATLERPTIVEGVKVFRPHHWTAYA